MRYIIKQIIKVITFVAIFIIILSKISNIFVLKGNGYGSDVQSFYKLEKNSLDLLFIGSSHSYATFSPNIIENETGLKSYNFATQQQPIYISYYYLKEALKTQKPKVVVLETHMLTIQQDYTTEGVVRDALDKMKFSFNKMQAITASVKDKSDYLSYYFNIIKYHSRYLEIGLDEIKRALRNETLDNYGFIGLPTTESIYFDNSQYEDIKYASKISDKNIEYLEKFIQLCEDKNIKLIMVKTPEKLDESTKAYLNYIKQITKENQIEYIDFNELFDELDLDFKQDFYDESHLSSNGAEKVSKYFCKNVLSDIK